MYIKQMIRRGFCFASMDKRTRFDEAYRIARVTQNNLDEASRVMAKSFFVDEYLAQTVGLHKSPEAVQEVSGFITHIAQDGISLVVVEKKTNSIVGALFNKFQVKGQDSIWRTYRMTCHHPSAVSWLKVIETADVIADVFGKTGADFAIEMCGLGILHQHRNKGASRRIMEDFVEISKELAKGKNVRLGLDDTHLALEHIPTVVSYVATANETRHLATQLKFKVAATIKYASLKLDGVVFKKIVGQPDFMDVVYRAL